MSARVRKGGVLAAILLLALMALLSFSAALGESPTFDEIAHIGAGLSYIQKFDLRMNPEHPPLPKVLSGFALRLRGTHADYSGPAWTYSKEFFPAFLGQWSFGESVIGRWNNSATTLAWARFPMLLLTLALGWVIFIYAAYLGGIWGGLLCLAVYVSTPVFLVFGPLVLTDIPIALFSVLTLWAFGNLWRDPERASIWIFAASLAGAFLSKFSAPILVFAILVSGLTTRWMALYDQPVIKAERKAWRRRRVAGHREGNPLGSLVGVCDLFLVFVESADRQSRADRQQYACGAAQAAAVPAVDLPARHVFGAVHLQPAKFPTWSRLSSRRVVLLSGRAGAEITAGFPGAPIAGAGPRFGP
jgi:hypothetical protein